MMLMRMSWFNGAGRMRSLTHPMWLMMKQVLQCKILLQEVCLTLLMKMYHPRVKTLSVRKGEIQTLTIKACMKSLMQILTLMVKQHPNFPIFDSKILLSFGIQYVIRTSHSLDVQLTSKNAFKNV